MDGSFAPGFQSSSNLLALKGWCFGEQDPKPRQRVADSRLAHCCCYSAEPTGSLHQQTSSPARLLANTSDFRDRRAACYLI
jgi:hypothetical protein